MPVKCAAVASLPDSRVELHINTPRQAARRTHPSLKRVILIARSARLLLMPPLPSPQPRMSLSAARQGAGSRACLAARTPNNE